jgi:hypothetical protein
MKAGSGGRERKGGKVEGSRVNRSLLQRQVRTEQGEPRITLSAAHGIESHEAEQPFPARTAMRAPEGSGPT